jgi:hypothetical protein
MTPDMMAAIGDPAPGTHPFPLVEHPLPGLRQAPPAGSSLTYINRIGIRKRLSTRAEGGNGRLHVACCNSDRRQASLAISATATRNPPSRCKPARRSRLYPDQSIASPVVM